MAIKFFPDNFIIWKVTLGKLEATKPAYHIFVAAPDLLTAHGAAMDHEREMAQDGNLVLSIEVAADCVLDAT